MAGWKISTEVTYAVIESVYREGIRVGVGGRRRELDIKYDPVYCEGSG